MEGHNIESMINVIAYIENQIGKNYLPLNYSFPDDPGKRYLLSTEMAGMNLLERDVQKKLDLDTIAEAVHYSKFYLHRMFTRTVGITIHDYIRRRQLTEAARQLIFSEKPIIEIAMSSGYESQQAFSDIFKSMYKQTPMEYKKNKRFYPLQLPVSLNRDPSVTSEMTGEIVYAVLEDIPRWMDFVSLAIDGFPGFQEEQHREQIKSYVKRGQALVMRDGMTMIGAAAFSRQNQSIDFLGVHPQYRRCRVEEAFLDYMMEHVFVDNRAVSISTFREGDRADTGQRAEYMGLGFVGAEFLTEFEYPTQRMVLNRFDGARGSIKL